MFNKFKGKGWPHYVAMGVFSPLKAKGTYAHHSSQPWEPLSARSASFSTLFILPLPALPVTWWTIGMLLLTNLFTIYIHFSHTPAGVVITSPTLLYLPSNPLQPCFIACMSLWVITKILTLICQQFLWPYSC